MFTVNRKVIERALETIESEFEFLSEPSVANAVAIIRCELRGEDAPMEVKVPLVPVPGGRGADPEMTIGERFQYEAVRAAVLAEVLEICEDPRWVDGLAIAEEVRRL